MVPVPHHTGRPSPTGMNPDTGTGNLGNKHSSTPDMVDPPPILPI